MRTIVRGLHARLLVVTAAAAVTAGVWPGAVATGASGPAQQAPATPQAQPLTADQVAMLKRVRENIAREDEVLQRFAYTLDRRTFAVRFGKVTNGEARTYQVGPSPYEPGKEWRRLVAIDGKPLSPDEVRRHEEKARRDLEAEQRRRARESAPERARRHQKEQREAQRQKERLADMERVYRFEALGREVIDGRPVLVLAVTPRADARPATDAGEMMKRMRGTAWVDEADAEIVKIEMRAVDDINIGWGMIGRVHTGFLATYRRVRLSQGVWVPAEGRFTGSGRTLMLLPFQLDTWAKYRDFREAAAAAPSAADGARR